MNYVRDVVAARPPDELALITLGTDGTRYEWTFGQLVKLSGHLAGTFAKLGVQRGSVVLSLIGNTPEYVLTMLACLRLGAAMLPCSEQLRPKDVALRLDRARPGLVAAHLRNAPTVTAAQPAAPAWFMSEETTWIAHEPPPYADLADTDPAFVLFTSGTAGEPKLVTHAQRYLAGQHLQATEWMAAQPGELVWSTAAPGWSKATRNGFVAPWACGAVALLQDWRFDPAERLATIRAEGVNVLCMAPTEYRLIAAAGPIGELPSLRRAITAGEPLGVPAFEAWRQQTGLEIADGYGQTETGQVTGVRPGEVAPPGSMGRPLPGIRVEIFDDELCVDPSTVPTFFLGYDGGTVPEGMWHTGDVVRQDADGWLHFVSRADDVILSAGYRIGPAEVESTLLSHPAVRECAVIGLPDDTRGQIVAAAVVLRDADAASEEMIAELQEHVRTETAPYKYPRRIWFVDAIPKTNSGKIARRELRPQ